MVDDINRMKDAPAGVPRGKGTGGSFAPAKPNSEAIGVSLLAAVTVQLSGSFKLSSPRGARPEYPESLPQAEVSFDFGDSDGTTYTHVEIPADEAEMISLTVWVQDGDKCDSRDAEGLPYDDDTVDDLIDWAHSVHESIDANIAGYLNTGMTGEVQAAIVAVATGAPTTVAAAPPVIDFDKPNIDGLTDEQVKRMLTAIINRTGIISPIIDQDEALYRLYEDRDQPRQPQTADETVAATETTERIEYLERHLGGKDQLARAVTESNAWGDLEELMVNALSDTKRGTAAKVIEAIDEIYATY
jgi:hypothetical protein